MRRVVNKVWALAIDARPRSEATNFMMVDQIQLDRKERIVYKLVCKENAGFRSSLELCPVRRSVKLKNMSNDSDCEYCSTWKRHRSRVGLKEWKTVVKGAKHER